MFLIKCFRNPLAFLKCLIFWRFKGSTKASKLRYFFVFFFWSYGAILGLVGNRGIGEKENRAPGGTRGVRRTRETWEQANKRTRNRGKGVQGNKGLGGARKQGERGSKETGGKGNKKTNEQEEQSNRATGQQREQEKRGTGGTEETGGKGN